MKELATSILSLAGAITKYISDTKSRHGRAALHCAVRIKHIDELLESLKQQNVTKVIIKKVAALKSKKRRLWKSFDSHIAAN